MSDESGPRPGDEGGGDRPERDSRGRGTPEGSGRRAMRGSRFFSSVDASLLGLGTQMLSEVVAGVLLGLGLDHILGTKGRWVVVGSIAGVAVAMVTVVRLAMKPQTPRRSAPGSRSAPSTLGQPKRSEDSQGGHPPESRPADGKDSK